MAQEFLFQLYRCLLQANTLYFSELLEGSCKPKILEEGGLHFIESRVRTCESCTKFVMISQVRFFDQGLRACFFLTDTADVQSHQAACSAEANTLDMLGAFA